MLFLTEENQFSGPETNITYEEVLEGAKAMDM